MSRTDARNAATWAVFFSTAAGAPTTRVDRRPSGSASAGFGGRRVAPVEGWWPVAHAVVPANRARRGRRGRRGPAGPGSAVSHRRHRPRGRRHTSPAGGARGPVSVWVLGAGTRQRRRWSWWRRFKGRRCASESRGARADGRAAGQRHHPARAGLGGLRSGGRLRRSDGLGLEGAVSDCNCARLCLERCDGAVRRGRLAWRCRPRATSEASGDQDSAGCDGRRDGSVVQGMVSAPHGVSRQNMSIEMSPIPTWVSDDYRPGIAHAVQDSSKSPQQVSGRRAPPRYPCRSEPGWAVRGPLGRCDDPASAQRGPRDLRGRGLPGVALVRVAGLVAGAEPLLALRRGADA